MVSDIYIYMDLTVVAPMSAEKEYWQRRVSLKMRSYRAALALSVYIRLRLRKQGFYLIQPMNSPMVGEWWQHKWSVAERYQLYAQGRNGSRVGGLATARSVHKHRTLPIRWTRATWSCNTRYPYSWQRGFNTFRVDSIQGNRWRTGVFRSRKHEYSICQASN